MQKQPCSPGSDYKAFAPGFFAASMGISGNVIGIDRFVQGGI